MGADIHGWVEFRGSQLDEVLGETLWRAAIDAGTLLGRNYTMFGSLFGVRNHSDFQPVAAGRGLPADVSATVKAETESDGDWGHSHTFVSWLEIQAVDWEEAALAGMAYGYREGERQWHTGIYLERSDPCRREGHTWSEGSTRYRVESITRKEALGPECQMLFELMRILAQRYGSECVRLVVWFDS